MSPGSDPDPDPAEVFEDLREGFVDIPGVSDGRMFQSDGLTYGGKVFAALSKGQLLVKLPADRVAALIDDGVGLPFDANKGRPMREWMLVPMAEHSQWPPIAAEALSFAQDRLS